MSYIPITLNSVESDTRRTYEYTLPLCGVSFSMNEADFEEGKCRLMENMEINTGSLSSIPGGEKIFSDFAPEGELYSITKDGFCGKIIAHIGNKLYMFDKALGQPEVLSEVLAEKPSIFVEFLSKLYIYCDRHVFCVDTGFNFTEEECEAPVLYKDADTSFSHFTDKTKIDVPLNLVSPRIAVEYAPTQANIYSLPYEVDMTRSVEVLVEGEVYPAEKYEVKERKIVFLEYQEVFSKNVTIRFYVKNDDDIGYKDVLYQCKVCEVFGGNNLSGTRIFMTGNPDQKGKYYKSGLLNPLYFSEDDYEIVGDGCDNVTGFVKMYDFLIILTERAVYRMEYVMTENDPLFTIKMLSNEIGCDMPYSIQLVDNRVVFANSNKGIFILDSENEAGEHNVKPISSNIERNGSFGFFDCDNEHLKNACSIDFDRKYILCVNNKAFVWDYGKSPYSSSSNYSMAQSRLIFTLRHFEDVHALFNLSGTLCSVSKNNVSFIKYGKSTAPCDWKILSGKMPLNLLGTHKYITDMSIVLKRKEDASMNLTLFSDDVMYYSTPIKCKPEKTEKVMLKLPSKKLSFFEFELYGSGGVEIYSIIIKYKII